jgi:hypothetical protein
MAAQLQSLTLIFGIGSVMPPGPDASGDRRMAAEKTSSLHWKKPSCAREIVGDE